MQISFYQMTFWLILKVALKRLVMKSRRSVMRLINQIPAVEDIFQGVYLESMDTNSKETSSYLI